HFSRMRTERNGEPFGSQLRSTSHVETFHLGDELESAATAVAITETVPEPFLNMDHELSSIAAFVNRTAANKLVANALELTVDVIVRKNCTERHNATYSIEITIP